MVYRSSGYTIGASYGNTVTVLSDDQRAQAVRSGQLTELVQSLYSIVLFDTATGEIFKADNDSLDPANRTTNAEYFFRVPPKVHEMDEQFATNVVATQDGGKFVESYGSVFKVVRLSGTTGLRPNKVARSAGIPSNVNSTLSTLNLGLPTGQFETFTGSGLNLNRRTIPANEITGHDDIIFLRNIFRKYSDLKQTDQVAGRVIMLWRNIKDADYWVVEPEEFRLSQDSSSPLTYEYSISLKLLSRFSFEFAFDPDPLEERLKPSRLYSRIQEYNQNILNLFLSLSSQINRVRGLGTAVSNLVLSPLLNVATGLSAVRSSASGVERYVYQRTRELEQGLEEALALVVNLFEPQDPLVHDLRRAVVLTARVRIDFASFDGTARDTGATIRRYASPYTTPGTGTTAGRTPRDATYIGTETAPAGTATTIVRGGEDIRDLAARILGDRTRWRVLVAMNKLRYPFISTVAAPGVLVPGDTVLYPSTSTSTGMVRTTVAPATEGTADQDLYGRDLRLKTVSVGGVELSDLDLSQRGDLSTISGVPNVLQAIQIKFATERGELPAHQTFGAKFPIGRKATSVSFNDLRLTTLATLNSDNRILSVKDLKFSATGDKLTASAALVLKNSERAENTTFALRRF